ncbi:S8 family peptidase [Rhodopseudomonas boonkerdii]|nr:S8 family peptidase [Rhodopseudomonas boonkerdii]
MADAEKYRHIHLRGLGKPSEDFRARGGGNKKRPPSISDRVAHAQALRKQLDESIADLESVIAAQKESGVPAAKRGAAITVSARPSVPIEVGSKRANSPGLKLLSVRRASDDEDAPDAPDQATFFIAKKSLETLRKNLDEYAEWRDLSEAIDNDDIDDEEEDEKGRPRNFWLFESGAAIRSATLRDFWTDQIERFPKKRTETAWEVWTLPGFENSFLKAIDKLGIKPLGKPTAFIETVVRNVSATPQQLEALVRSSASVVELRSASTFVSDFYDMEPERRASVMEKVASRILGPPADAPRITLLDTGVNRSHDLLSSSLPQSRCFTVVESWGTNDRSGHGTRMAGVAQFGDLEGLTASSLIALSTALESVVVAAPTPTGDVPARDALMSAVALVEREPHRRVFCLAQTAQGEEENGRPTSTSAVLDQLAYGDGDNTRLFCAAVGNAPHSLEEPYQIAEYEDRNENHAIQAPAQAVNALSVGAVSLKDPGSSDVMVAPVGDLMPTSRTARRWSRPHPIKPDIVMEGGNFLVEPDGVFSRPSPAHMVVTTSHQAPISPLTISGETSTATAMAAGLAARLAARYPLYRMETIRGLLAHSADWTPAMLAQAERDRDAGYSNQDVMDLLLGRYGWGVPNEERLFESAANALTLIVEDDMQPYERPFKGGKLQGIRLKEMKYFKLPWPEEVLRELNQAPVEMRCTLSYFVEPDPHAAARNRASDRYPSHRLKFDVKRSGESDDRAQLRNNQLAGGDMTESAGSGEGWVLPSRSRGTLVQDIWRGMAYQLADRDGISVVPVRGWWGDMPGQDRYERKINYSLIVSIRTPADAGGDLFAEVLPKIPAELFAGVVPT